MIREMKSMLSLMTPLMCVDVLSIYVQVVRCKSTIMAGLIKYCCLS